MTTLTQISQWHTCVLDQLIPNPKELTNNTLSRARLFVGITSYALLLNLVLLAVRYQASEWSDTTISTAIGNALFASLLITYYVTKN